MFQKTRIFAILCFLTNIAISQNVKPTTSNPLPQSHITFHGSVDPMNISNKHWNITLEQVSAVKHYKDPEVIKQKEKANALKKQYYKNNPVIKDEAEVRAPVLKRTFPGNGQNGWTPPDNSMAVSTNGDIVTAVNSNIMFMDKDGNVSFDMSFGNYLDFLQLPGGYFDPKVIYDPEEDKFIVIIVNGNTPDISRVVVGFSTTNNPNDTWYFYSLAGDPNEEYWFDYPSVGISNDKLYITGNLFSAENMYGTNLIYSIDKANGYTGENISINNFRGVNGANSSNTFTMVPVSSGTSQSFDNGMYFIASFAGWGNVMDLFYLPPNGTSFTTESITVPYYSAPGQAQQFNNGNLLDCGDSRVLGAIINDNIIHYCHNTTDEDSGFSQLNYGRVNVNTNTATVRNFGLDGYDYSYPNIALYSKDGENENVLLSFVRSGSEIYPEARAVTMENDVWSNSILIKSGDSFVDFSSSDEERWGDYSGICKRHGIDDIEVYTANCYGGNQNIFITYIGVFGNEAGSSPIANFSANTTSGEAPLMVDFSNLSTNGNTFSWDFGDGNSSSLLNPSHTYESPGMYTVRMTATNDFGADLEEKVNYITVTDPSGYCGNEGQESQYEWIESVEVGDFTNTSGNNGGYGDFTSSVIDLTIGTDYEIKLTPAFESDTYDEYWRIWIDLNQNNAFENNEIVFESEVASTEPNIGSLILQNGSLTGQTRMRISMKYISESDTTLPEPCTPFEYGEVEDYTVNLIDNSTSGYCGNQSEESQFEWIESVGVNAFTYESGNDGGYGDFTNFTFDITKEVNNNIWLTPGFEDDLYNEYWRVWIDLNQNNTFENDEIVFESEQESTDVNTGTIILPSSVQSGQTRMRVIMKYTSATDPTLPEPCEAFAFGEVEDYTVNIVDLSGSAPVTNFFADNTSGVTPHTVNFTDQSTNEPTSWFWNFGNGQTSNDQNPSTTYNTTGTFSVSLVTENAFGQDGESKIDYITVTQAGSAPVTNFLADDTSGEAPHTVTFSDQSTNEPTNWNWDFGNGQSSALQNPSVTYSNPGTYTVTLISSNDFGSDPETKNGYIIVTQAGSAPVANFSADDTSGEAPHTVTFSDQSANEPTNWNWDFGNGQSSSLQNPTIIYSDEGIYTVTLIAGNDFGSDPETKNDFIIVTGPSAVNDPSGIFQSMIVYPNPSKGDDQINIKIDLKESKVLTFDIYDLQGRIVKTLIHRKIKEGTSYLKFDSNKLSSGLYYIIVKNENKKIIGNEKIVIK